MFIQRVVVVGGRRLHLGLQQIIRAPGVGREAGQGADVMAAPNGL